MLNFGPFLGTWLGSSPPPGGRLPNLGCLLSFLLGSCAISVSVFLLINNYYKKKLMKSCDLTLFIVIGSSSITPHFFQVVKFACFCQHHMNNNIDIVDQNPLHLLVSLMVIRVFLTFIFYTEFYMICNCSYLWLVTGLTDNKKVGNSLINFSQVKGNDILPLFSWIAAIMVLMIFEFFVNRAAPALPAGRLFFLRLDSDSSCSK